MGIVHSGPPHVAWLPASRHLVLVATDSKDDQVWRSVWDDSLMPVVPAGKIAASAHWIRIVADGDGASIAWVDDSSGQQLRYGRLSGDGTLPRMSVGLGQLDTSLGHYHALQRVGQSTVALWTDTTMNRTFSAMRVCSSGASPAGLPSTATLVAGDVARHFRTPGVRARQRCAAIALDPAHAVNRWGRSARRQCVEVRAATDAWSLAHSATRGRTHSLAC